MSSAEPLETNWLLEAPSSNQTAFSKQTLITYGAPDGFSDTDDDDYFQIEGFDDDSDDDYVIPTSIKSKVLPAPVLPVTKNVVLLNRFRNAVLHRSEDVVAGLYQKLQEQSFKIDDQLDGNWTALLLACYARRPEIVKFLAENGADLKSGGTLNGFHALASGIVYENTDSSHASNDSMKAVEIAKTLLTAGADLNMFDGQNAVTPLHLAVKKNDLVLIAWMLDNGADANLLDTRRRSPLEWAVARGYGVTVRLLLRNGANMDTINREGLMAHEVAGLKGYPKIAKAIWMYQTKAVESLDELDFESDAAVLETAEDWTESQRCIYDILTDVNQRKYFPKFREMAFHDFLCLDDKKLKEMDVNVLADRMKIMDILRRFHSCDWKPGSIPKFPDASPLGAVELLEIFRTLEFKFSVMRATVKYFTARTRVLQSEQSAVNPILQVSQVERMTKYCQKLALALKMLKANALLVKDALKNAEKQVDLELGDLIN